jgi:hypothetical protein
MLELSDEEKRQILSIVRCNRVGTSRPEDRARTKLKNLGLIKFDRFHWEWHLTHAGIDMAFELNMLPDPSKPHACERDAA